MVVHLEVGIQESADLVDVSQVRLGKTLQELRAEGLALVVGRSEAASCQELGHPHHEQDLPNQAEPAQEVQ